MIDPTDNASQQLPLEPTKRGRGRPTTGKAMTPAEKQKAYRDRQKAAAGNVTENKSTRETGSIELLRERALSRGRTCVQQARMLVEAEKRIGALEELLAQRSERRLPEGIEQINAELVAKVERLERELAKAKIKAAKAGPTKRRYVLEFKYENRITGTAWEDDITGDYSSKREAEKACARMNEPGVSDTEWRVRERRWV